MLPAWLKRRFRSADARQALPYHVECACGRKLSGSRTSKAQKVVCPKCGLLALIFPSSPLLYLREKLLPNVTGAEVADVPAVKPQVAAWRKPLWAGGTALVVCIALFIVVLNSGLFRSSPGPFEIEKVRAEVAAGRQALQAADHSQVAEHFRKARQLVGGESSAPEVRWLEQVEKEAALMSEISSESLSEMLQLQKGPNDKEWRRRFENKAIIFDTQVQSAGGGVHRLDYPMFAAGHPVRIEIHGSALLRSLPVEWPTRLVLGLRLAEVRRDARGNWLVLANPDSLVLFTEPAMFNGSSVSVDADLADALRRQTAWLDLTPP